MTEFRHSHRFAIEPFAGRFGKVFMVRDAAWITDGEVREGKRPPTVACCDTVDEARQFCDDVEAGKIRSEPHEANFVGWPELKARVFARADAPAREAI